MGCKYHTIVLFLTYRYDCHGSVLSQGSGMIAYWRDREGNKVNYWPGGKGLGCACGVDKSCIGGEFEISVTFRVVVVLKP